MGVGEGGGGPSERWAAIIVKIINSSCIVCYKYVNKKYEKMLDRKILNDCMGHFPAYGGVL